MSYAAFDMSRPDTNAFLPSPSSSPDSYPTTSPLAAAWGDAPPAAASVLVLEPDDVRNTTLRPVASAVPTYTVRTDNRGDRTDVRLAAPAHADRETLATIHRKALAPTVTLNRERLSVKRWLRSGLGPNSPITFEARGRTYEWRMNALGQLTLFEESNPETPIAWFTRSRKRAGMPPTRAYLALEPKAEVIRDDVVVSFLIVEESARMLAMRRGARF